jgi:DNA invertase Pin-like site-specific DNA recombinase
MISKLTPAHLERSAIVYLRQSTPDQVRNHKESTERQYALAERAQELGWRKEQIRVLDGDLGKSGKTTEGRGDFHQLCASVGLGEVGAVFALEASRLSRSQTDWHRLLDLCAWTLTLLVDHDGIYDPNDFNDRVILGFKGTWSHTELHAMRLRMQGARRHKAQRGEYRQRPPTGFVYDHADTLIADPDEGVVEAVRSVFSLFRSLGSAYAVAMHFARRGLQFPHRHWTGGPHLGPLRWAPLRSTRVIAILHNPTYAGAYVHGRKVSRPVVKEGRLVGTQQVAVAPSDWSVFLPNAHIGYISWDQFEEHQKLLTTNRTTVETGQQQGRPRAGAALLVGLAICGRCGRRMLVRYTGDDGVRIVYLCPRRGLHLRPDDPRLCWQTPGARLDLALAAHVLERIQLDNLDLSLEVLNHLEEEQAQEERQWKLRLERARIEATRAERQYDQVEPENRIVARTLERRWEEKLAELAELERAYGEDRQQLRGTLSSEERGRILGLAADLPAIWRAPTTRAEERKELLGLLVKQVSLVPEDLPRRQVRMQVLWHTGATTELVVARPHTFDAVRTPAEALEVIREMMEGHTDVEIASVLREQGIRTGKGNEFSGLAVATARHTHDLMKQTKNKRAAATTQPRQDGRYSAAGVAALVGVSADVVKKWRRQGLLPAIQETERGAWWYEISENLLSELKMKTKAHGRQQTPAHGVDSQTINRDTAGSAV